MRSHDPRIYLLHIRDCCENLLECTRLRASGSIPEHILFAAACRHLEILGEASRKVGEAFRSQHPGIPWREMNDLRNVLIHNYEGADETLVWGIIGAEIPRVARAIGDLLATLDE